MQDQRLVLSVALVAALAAVVPDSAAADAGAGAFRLGVDVPVLVLQTFPDVGDPYFQFGLWGQPPVVLLDAPLPFVGASGAYQVTDAIVIGARLGLGVAVFETAFTDTTVGAFALLPFFEYLFLDGSIRPFIGAQAGFQVIVAEDDDARAWFIGGGMGGVHIFAADGFSISPTLFVDFLYNGYLETAGLDVIAAVSFEGWIGGSGGSSPAPAAAPAY